MAEYAPPSGPPPPKVPEGWKAVWNDQYKEWFYVNIYTKQSQWDKPTEPIYPPGEGASSADAPPHYDDKSARPVGPEKGQGAPFGGPQHSLTDDERLAQQLQAEENKKAAPGTSDRGEADSYYAQQGSSGMSNPSPYSQPGQKYPPQYGQQAGQQYVQQYGQQFGQQQGGIPSQTGELPPRPDDRGHKGLLGKIFGGSGKKPQQQQYYPPQQQQGYGYPPHQGYYPPQGYPPTAAAGRRPGMGAGGAAALGIGGGLLGGMLLGEALEGHDGGDDGGYGGDGGGGFGGDDGGGFDGGDMGGDMGGDF